MASNARASDTHGWPWAWGKRTFVMGILNITPDSFSGDGLWDADEDPVALALEQAEALLADGADILDVGGESTRPGAEPVGAEEEMERVVPVIRALWQRFACPISVDTSKAEVARAALEAGAAWVNDVWALAADPRMGAVVAEFDVPVVLMHNRRTADSQVEHRAQVGAYYLDVDYTNVVEVVRADLLAAVDRAKAAGIAVDRIILDPGLGFGKTPAQSLELLDDIDILKELGYPILVGPSRKSFIGLSSGDLPPDERVEGTAAAVSIAIDRGADIVRVHDVLAMVRVAQVTDAIVRPRLDPSRLPQVGVE